MAKLNSTISAKQLAGWQWATDGHNTRETARRAALTPPEVHIPLTVDDYASWLNGLAADDYVRQADEKEIEEIRLAFKEGNQAKRDAIKNAAK